MTRLLLSLFVLLCGSVALAQPDEEGTKDHPDIPRFPGYYIHWAAEKEFTTLELPLDDNDKVLTKEGKLVHVEYRLKDGAKQPGSVELLRNSENAFKKRGGKALYKHDDGSSAIGTFVMPLGTSERYLLLNVGPGSYNLQILDVKAMEQKIEVSASEMRDALDNQGFIALYGILFDTGKDTIKPESAALLAEIVKLLDGTKTLKLAIEGHTDNVGKAAANQTLSKQRAESVKKYLVAKGIAGARLTTAGHGDKKPVADNRTEEGRAKNRRVELVKK